MSLAADFQRKAFAMNAQPWRWLIVVVTIVVVMLAPTFTILGSAAGPPSGSLPVVLPLAIAAFLLQLRHGFLVADGRRPRSVWLSFVLLILIVYVPLRWFGWNWQSLEICVLASLPLVLSGWWAATAIATIVLATNVAVVTTGFYLPGPVGITFEIFYVTVALLGPATALYGSARLVRLVDELREARTELAALAVGRERLRVSRDLHDLLGQSLSAIALKGDLALRLLRRDPVAASAEIEGVASLARDAAHGISAITRDEHALSLHSEGEGAMALLSAAGVKVRVELDLDHLNPTAERVLAWALREGVANALRHSQAHFCSITGGRHDHTVFLQVVNDGAPGTSGEGTGLAGLTERARALSGSVAARNIHGGRFQLRVELPEESE